MLEVILPIIAIVIALIGVCLSFAQLRRTAKLPEPPMTPVCTTIVGVKMARPHDLATSNPALRNLGFERRR
jgi:hypothetical protein